MKSKKVHFIGIGAQKAGTSWLFKNLSELEEFDLLPEKELNYFDRNKSYASSNKLSNNKFLSRLHTRRHVYYAIKNPLKSLFKLKFKDANFYRKWHYNNISDEWYLSLFEDSSAYTGEITPSYMLLEKEDIMRMKELLPGVKVVLLLRNPIERAWSSYRYSTKKIPNFNFEKVKYEEVIEFMESEGQTLRTDYIRAIRNYSSVFAKGDILIGFYDAIIENPNKLLHDILDHILSLIHISEPTRPY